MKNAIQRSKLLDAIVIDIYKLFICINIMNMS